MHTHIATDPVAVLPVASPRTWMNIGMIGHKRRRAAPEIEIKPIGNRTIRSSGAASHVIVAARFHPTDRAQFPFTQILHRSFDMRRAPPLGTHLHHPVEFAGNSYHRSALGNIL